MQKYTKAFLAIAGVLIPTLNSMGVGLPGFLTVDWVNTVLLALTPVLVFFFPNVDKTTTPNQAASPVTVGVLVLVMAMLTLTGCAGTRDAYKAADGLEETAWVMNQHYLALVNEGSRLRQNGTLSGDALAKAQKIVTDARPLLLQLSNAAQSYEAVRNAENEAELTAAIARAAVALSDLVNAIREAGGSASVTEPAGDAFATLVLHYGEAA